MRCGRKCIMKHANFRFFVFGLCFSFTLFASVDREISSGTPEFGNLFGCRVLEFYVDGKKDADVVVCPKTGNLFVKDSWIPYTPRHGCKHQIVVSDYAIEGIVTSDIASFNSVGIKQGRTEFNYPYDKKEVDGFQRSDLINNAIDGDFMSYSADGKIVAAYATFANDGKTILWHDSESMEVLDKMPVPDADAELIYYRRQNVSTQVTIFGVVQMLNSGFISFFEHGIEAAVQLSESLQMRRKFDWQRSLFAGYCRWTEEFKPTSVKDPRKFYVVHKNGLRALAMFQEEGGVLLSPITHAQLSIARSDIVRFESINDCAYEERDCLPALKVEWYYKRFMANGNGRAFENILKWIMDKVASYILGVIIPIIFLWVKRKRFFQGIVSMYKHLTKMIKAVRR